MPVRTSNVLDENLRSMDEYITNSKSMWISDGDMNVDGYKAKKTVFFDVVDFIFKKDDVLNDYKARSFVKIFLKFIKNKDINKHFQGSLNWPRTHSIELTLITLIYRIPSRNRTYSIDDDDNLIEIFLNDHIGECDGLSKIPLICEQNSSGPS
ncbi:hypothetical protein RF11_15119 [Thelohanellus kitauei]|uniref:Uncharacterized protein n=1 Tax=Thelohanellus kitauei TaxID=669202 RepID=A0A0C2MI09_THEKT|nr:hypothetical protein RF11_15119 [Thelohanellus kitauei]